MAEYIEREKAIECIKPHVKPTTVYGEGYMRAIEHAVDILELIPAADVQSVNRWISCKDKMPEHGVTVLIYAGNHMIMLAWYDKDMEYFYICDSDYKYNPLDVTHWQPLPEPPKEG